MNPDSFIIETASSKWIRFSNGFQKATCIVDLPNDLALNINSKTGKIEVYSRKPDGIYKLVGNIKMGSATEISRGKPALPSTQNQLDLLLQEPRGIAWLY